MDTWQPHELVFRENINIPVDGELTARDIDNIAYLFSCNNVDDQILDMMFKSRYGVDNNENR